jgi:hypothetical protein
VLTGCGGGSVRIGWRETSSLNRKRASYVTFDGEQSRTFSAKAGQAIDLE